ncbi:MAG: 1-deoxy-D-xylulose-5-phosphate synthase N-terminal domain-containing protein [bacterium]
MYNILDEKELGMLKEKEPQRFQYQAEGGFYPHTLASSETSQKNNQAEEGVGVYLNLKGLELAPIDGVDIVRIENIARVVRGLSFAAMDGIKSGHPGGSSSKTEILLSLLFSGIFAFDPQDPKNPGRDRIVWSAGHCTPLQHSLLALIWEVMSRKGVKLDKDALGYSTPSCLTRFRHCDGPSGHVESSYALADASTGSSGHGFSVGLGLAILQKSNGLDAKVHVIAGDAETEEGISYEARNSIISMGADNIIVTLDNNNFGIDGPIGEVISLPIDNYWFGPGWNIIEIDGHNPLEIAYAYHKAYQGFGNKKATVIICHTIKGKFYGKLAGTAGSHGAPVAHPDYVEIMKAIGFDIPGIEGDTQKDIDVVISQLTQEDVEYIFDRLNVDKERIRPEKELSGKMAEVLKDRPMADYKSIKRPDVLPPELVFKEGEAIATRKATEAFFEWMMKQSAFFYVGSGDLAGSILTKNAENVYGIISPSNPLGRGFRYGIAEQNMAMMGSSLTQDILPGGYQAMSVFASYGVFTSIMANSVRMALINNYVNPKRKGFFIMLAAHDGPETGEDGETHHGLFWMSLFNAYPGIKVYKPMDANETIEMLFYAMEKQEPIALSIMRPGTPVLKRENGVPPAKEAINGAYVYKPFAENGKKKVIFAICGGQVMANVLASLPELEQNADIKIIAVTSPELFEELKKNDPAKADSILPDEERQYVITLHNGWPAFLNPFILPGDYQKRVIGIDRFLKSGAVDEVYKFAEFDVEGLKKKILGAL